MNPGVHQANPLPPESPKTRRLLRHFRSNDELDENEDSNEFYENLHFTASQEPSGILTIQREPSSITSSIFGEDENPLWKRIFKVIIALVVPLPYGMAFGNDGVWVWASLAYLAKLFQCPIRINNQSVRPALLLWCFCMGLAFLIIYLPTYNVPALVFSAYYLISGALLALSWCKVVICNRIEKRMEYTEF